MKTNDTLTKCSTQDLKNPEKEKKTFEKAGSNLDLEGLWSILPTL